MYRKLVPVFLSVLSLLLVAAGPSSAGQGPYGKAGRWITDDQGRATVINGWNVINKRAPYTPEAMGFGEDDAQFIADQGFDTVRLGIIWKGLEPTPGKYDDAYLDSLERTYDLLAAHGISVLLSFHQDMYNERFQGEGFPDWAVLGDARWLPRPHLGFPNNYAFNYAMQRAYDHFWNNERGPDGRRLWTAYAQAWAHVAERFRGKAELLGYSVMNEPFAGTATYTCFKKSTGCSRFDTNRLTLFDRQVKAAIRAVDPVGLVWYMPQVTFNFGIRTTHDDLQDDRAGFSFNTYCQYTPTNWPLGVLTWYHLGQSCKQLGNLVMDLADRQAAKFDDAILMTEWGGTDDLKLLETDAELAEQHMLSWQQWAYWTEEPANGKPHDSLLVDQRQPPAGSNVKADRLAVAARVRPSRVSGTPGPWSFSPTTKRFAFTYSTLAPGQTVARFADGAETTIAVPPVQYPADYAVAVSGARVTSAPGARQLTLATCPGATSVTVSVAPGTTADAARTCGGAVTAR